jgi:hypothetical protein
VFGLAVVTVSVFSMPAVAQPWAQSLSVCLLFVAAAFVAAHFARQAPMAYDRRQVRTGTIVLAGFMAATYAGIIVNVLIRRSFDASVAVAQLKERLPANTRLVSLNGVHHLFAYLYAQPIDLHCWPIDDDDNLEWFCFSSVGEYRAPLPFAWEEVAVIPVDRNYHAKPENVVVVGRRLHEATISAPPRDSMPLRTVYVESDRP